MMPKDKARVGTPIKVGTKEWKPGEWVEGHFVWAGGEDLWWESGETLFMPWQFDRFELSAYALSETFGADLGEDEETRFEREMSEEMDRVDEQSRSQ